MLSSKTKMGKRLRGTTLWKPKNIFTAQVLALIVSFTAASPASKITFDSLTESSATLSWTTFLNSTLCQVSYTVENSTEVITNGVKPTLGGGFNLYRTIVSQLQPNTTYDLSVECFNGSRKTWLTTVYFRTLFKNSPQDVTSTTNPASTHTFTSSTTDGSTTSPMMTQAPSTMSTLDIVLGSLSALIGGVILGVVGFYAWRRYQRRRRIRRFFRHHQLAQPFPSEMA